MNKRIIPLAALAMMAGGSAVAQSNDTHRNPFLSPYTTPYQIPPFEQITYDDYLPALEAGITQAKANIEAIVNNPATPTFDNTILALDARATSSIKSYTCSAPWTNPTIRPRW